MSETKADYKPCEYQVGDVYGEFEYLRFVFISSTGKTKILSCQNKSRGNVLGLIKWYNAWRQYCYFPSVQAVYSAECLRDIGALLEQINKEHHGH